VERNNRLLWAMAMALSSMLSVLVATQYDIVLGVVLWLVLTMLLLWLRPQ
jgi:hypothetical protein